MIFLWLYKKTVILGRSLPASRMALVIGLTREAIFQAVADFTGPGQDDDITLAVIKLL